MRLAKNKRRRKIGLLEEEGGQIWNVEVAESADAPALGAGGETLGSSSLPLDTDLKAKTKKPLCRAVFWMRVFEVSFL